MTKNKDVDPVGNLTTFTNSVGETYPVRGLSPLTPGKIMAGVERDRLASGKTLPKIPTYTVKTVAGEVETHEHSSSTLVVEGEATQTAINQALWDEYLRDNLELQREYNVRIMKAVLFAVQAQPTQQWRDEMVMTGVELPPEGSAEERYLYAETHVIQSPSDLSQITVQVFQMAGIIPVEATAEVEATFRSYVERAFIEAGKSTSQSG